MWGFFSRKTMKYHKSMRGTNDNSGSEICYDTVKNVIPHRSFLISNATPPPFIIIIIKIILPLLIPSVVLTEKKYSLKTRRFRMSTWFNIHLIQHGITVPMILFFPQIHKIVFSICSLYVFLYKKFVFDAFPLNKLEKSVEDSKNERQLYNTS